MGDEELKATRQAFRLSQSELARRADVPRVNICIAELGGRPLSTEHRARIEKALRAEARRLRGVLATLERQNRTVDGTEGDRCGCEGRP